MFLFFSFINRYPFSKAIVLLGFFCIILHSSSIAVVTTPAIASNCSGALTSATPNAGFNIPVGGCITAGTYTVTAGTSGIGAPSCGAVGATLQREAFYSFNASAGQNITVTVATNSIGADLVVEIFSSCAAGGLIACGNNSQFNGAQSETVSAYNLAAATYIIRISNYNNGGTAALVITTACVSSIVTTAVPATCATATAITTAACAGTVMVNGTAGTALAGCCAGTISKEGWYSYTPAANGDAVISATSTTATNAGGNLLIQVYSGTCAGTLTIIGCANNITTNGSAQTEAVGVSGLIGGTTYFIRLVNIGTGPASGNMTLSSVCVNSATPVIVDGACLSSVSISDPTQDVLPAPSCITGTFKREGWFSFTIASGPQNVTITGTTNTGTTDPLIQAFSANCASNLTSIGCVNNNSATTEALALTALASGTYFFRIENAIAVASGNMNMTNICINTTPANDACSGAIVLTPDAPAVTCTAAYSATVLGSSQSQAVNCSGANSTNDDVWFSFVATSTQHTITVDPIAVSGLFAVFEVFSGSCGGTSLGCTISAVSGATISTTLTGLTPTNTYWVRVYDSGTGIATSPTFTICVTTPPLNNDCGGLITLTPSGACAPTAGTLNIATSSQVANCGGTVTNDVWYTFFAGGSSQTITVAPNGAAAGINAVFELFSSSCGGTSLGCTNGGGGGGAGTSESFTYTGLTPGTQYWVRVYHWGGVAPTNLTFNICILNPPPANDGCAGAILLSATVLCSPTTGDVSGATQTIPANCSGNANDDVWYRFITTSTFGQNYVITVVGSTFIDPVFEVYQTACAGTSINCTDANSITGGTETTTLTGLNTSTTYWVRVYDAGAGVPASTTFTICITTPPLNDDCSGTTLSVWGTAAAPAWCGGTTAGDNNGATPSGFASCAGTADDDVWFNFTATSSSHIVTIAGTSGTFDPVIQVFKTSCGGTSLGCTNLTGAGGTETVTLTGLTLAATYWIRVYSFGAGLPSPTTFNICISTPPVNDDCSGAITISPSVSNVACVNTTGTISGATQSSAGICPSASATNDDVWYTWNAGSTTQTITITGLAAGFDPVFEVFSGSCGGASLGCFNTNSGNIETTSLTTLTSGSQYWIRVYDSGTGIPLSTSFDICIQTPFNDFCSSAITVVCGGTYSGSTTSSTIAGDPGVTCGGATPPGRGVWYLYVGDGNNVTVDMCGGGPTWDSELLVFSGTCASMTCVAGNDDACTPLVGALSKITFGTVIGVNYYIFLGGWVNAGVGATGTYSFTVSCTVPPVNDQCTGAISVQCGGTYSGSTATASPNGDITGCGSATALIPIALWYVYNGVDNYNTGDSTYLTISLCGSAFNTQLAVFSVPSCFVPFGSGGVPSFATCCNGPFLCVAGNDDACGTSSSVTFMTQFGMRYFIEVYGFTVITVGQATGTFNMLLTGGVNPANAALSGCAPLPISLLMFTGREEGKRNLIEWKTASETNNDYFTLEKATDGLSFNTLQKVTGAGNSSSVISYSAYDNSPMNGINYYRLKQTDYNGAYTYSSIITIDNHQEELTISNVRPNPTNDELSYDIYSMTGQLIKIQVSDYSGRILIEEVQTISEGYSELKTKVDKLSKGIYSLKITTSDKKNSSIFKIVKN